MPFQKGNRANPNGRPPKERTLTNILEKAGNEKVSVDGVLVPRKVLAARLVWQFITEGKVTFHDGFTMKAYPKEWVQMVEKLYKQVDGLPRQDVDLTSQGKAITINVAVGDEPESE